MYTVIWCNEEGIQQERPFDSLEDAKLEAAALEEKYGWAEILDPNGNPIAM